MRLEMLFYWLGGLFALAAVIYFTWEYVIGFPPIVKTILLISLTVMFFSAGLLLQERDI